MTQQDEDNARTVLQAVQASHDVTYYVETDDDRAKLFDLAIAVSVASLPPGSDVGKALGKAFHTLSGHGLGGDTASGLGKAFAEALGQKFEYVDLVRDSVSRMLEVLPPGPVESPMLPALDFLLGRSDQPAFGATPMMIAIDAALQKPIDGHGPLDDQTRIDYAVAIGTASLLPKSDLGRILTATVERLRADGAPHADLVKSSADRMLRGEEQGPEPTPDIPALGLLHHRFFEEARFRDAAKTATDNPAQQPPTNNIVPLRPRS